jgi:hypothetical protein
MKKYSPLILIFLIFFISCESKKIKTDFSTEEKVIFDSLKLIAFNNIRAKTDSTCLIMQDSFYNVYVDSLMALRRAEIEALFKE